MKKIVFIILSCFIFSGQAMDRSKDLAAMTVELEKIKSVKSKEIKKVLILGDQAIGLLKQQKKKEGKAKLLNEVVRVYGEILEADENYYVVEFLYDYYSKNKKEVEAALKSNLSEKKQKMFYEHIKTYKRAQLGSGNG